MSELIDARYKYSEGKNPSRLSADSLAARDEFISKYARKEIFEKHNCFVCECDNLRLISEIDRYGFYYPTAVCTECGNVQQAEYYCNDVLVSFYERYYRKIYGNSSPEELYESQKEGKGASIYYFIKKHITPNRVLEVGCGAGGILSVFQDNRCEVLGLDFDDDYLDIARSKQIPVIKGSIDSLNKKDKYDLIILSHVLEHIIDPSVFLRKLSGHLNEGGVLYIEVPSLDHVSTGGYDYDLLRYWQNAHTIHFTTESLKLLCKRAGLSPIVTTSFIQSCWKVSGGSHEITPLEKTTSLYHTETVLSAIEAGRNSFKGRIIPIKTVVRAYSIKFLSIIRMKKVIKAVYLKLKYR